MRWSSTCLIPLLCLLGCGPSDGRLEVSGTVRYKSAPLDQGTIQFLPAEPGGSSMLLVPIKEGRYQVPRDRGIHPGKYRVLISAPVPGTREAPANAPPGENQPFKERIPAEYNSASKKTVEVEAGKPNVFDFDIP